MSNATAPIRNDREPAPVTTFTAAEGGSVKIDGAHIAREKNDRARVGPPRTVAAEIAADRLPGAGRLCVLEGGPLDGREVKISRKAMEYREGVPRSEGGGVVDHFEKRMPNGSVLRQAIVGGAYGNAVYRRTGEVDEDGLAIFEFVGVE